jgi:hypothetical protein
MPLRRDYYAPLNRYGITPHSAAVVLRRFEAAGVMKEATSRLLAQERADEAAAKQAEMDKQAAAEAAWVEEQARRQRAREKRAAEKAAAEAKRKKEAEAEARRQELWGRM